MKTSRLDSSHKQKGMDEYLSYYDIMILGRTGMGKTTTAEKILIANPTGKDYSYVPPKQNSTTTDSEVLADAGSTCQHKASRSKMSRQDEASSSNSIFTFHEDISMWHTPDDLENVILRLKNLIFFRSVEDSHKELIRVRTKESKSTDICELLSNDTSKVRVLDVPGFYGSNVNCSPEPLTPTTPPANIEASGTRKNSTNVHDLSKMTKDTDLGLMRKILHIKMAMKFKFNRIVYFLPITGVLKRNSRDLQMEISLMEHYFGRSIFECMVAVATLNSSDYQKFRDDVDLYPPNHIESTTRFFQDALCEVFGGVNVPAPQVIFISLNDTCEEVLRKIRESKVVREGVNLHFNPFTCARCNVKIGKLGQESNGEKEGEKEDGRKEEFLATCTYDTWSSPIPYEESTCHPMMIPKYTRIECVIGGIAHLFTFKVFTGHWPSFENFEEVCIKCKMPPQSRGCTKVKTEYIHEKSKGSITVDHTSEVKESYQYTNTTELDPDGEPQYDEDETMAVMQKKK